jgi:hypothetical protein
VSSRQTDDRPDDGPVRSALRENIEALRERRKQEKRDVSSEDKLAVRSPLSPAAYGLFICI